MSPMQPLASSTLYLDSFALDPARGCVTVGDQELSLRPKSFHVLQFLARNPDRLVTKDELIKAMWPNVAVTDDSLVQCIREIRLALRDDGQHIIRTVPRRGYRFIAPEIGRPPMDRSCRDPIQPRQAASTYPPSAPRLDSLPGSFCFRSRC